MHGERVVYRDLKLDNVMLDGSGHVKITDFGMCRERTSPNSLAETFCGTPDYIAPEIIKHESYSYSVDWWALGVLVYELFTAQPPFDGDDEDDLFDNILHQPVTYPRSMPENAATFVKQLLCREIRKRLGCGQNPAEELTKHAFFETINFQALKNLEVNPPFVPAKRLNFDTEFTALSTSITPTDKSVLATIDQSEFNGFSYTSDALILT